MRVPSLTRASLRAGLIIAGALTLALVVIISLASMSPSWWPETQQLDSVPTDVGDRLERAVVSETHRARPSGETWAMAVTQEQANAWLRDRLPKWASNRGIRAPQGAAIRVRFIQDAIVIGAQEREEGRVFSARVVPDLRSDGSLWVRLASVSAGRMPAPTGWALDALQAITGDDPAAQTSLANILAGKAPALPSAEVRLEDGRKLRPREVRIEPGRLVITWETFARAG